MAEGRRRTEQEQGRPIGDGNSVIQLLFITQALVGLYTPPTSLNWAKATCDTAHTEHTIQNRRPKSTSHSGI